MAWAARVTRDAGSRSWHLTEPKIDGLAISLNLSRAGWSGALLGGDGGTGEDVTNNVRTIAVTCPRDCTARACRNC